MEKNGPLEAEPSGPGAAGVLQISAGSAERDATSIRKAM